MNFPEEKHKDLSLFIKDYSLGIQRGFESIDFQELNKIATLMDEKIHDARTIFTCGNGGSCAISEHFVCDFLKGTADSSSIQPIIHSLSSNVPTVTAIANDISYGEVFSFQLEKYASSEDILICVSSSGNSENIINCINKAKSMGLKTISFVGFDGGKAKDISDLSIHIGINNYGIVEDIHQSLMHMLAQYLRLKNINDSSNITKIKF